MQLFPTKRSRLHDAMQFQAPELNPHEFVRQLLLRRKQETHFSYLGPDSLKVRGAISGRIYYFAKEGITLSVDPRDAESLARLPELKRLFAKTA